MGIKKIGSLFAGVGGFDLGFERAGFETAWAVEIDPKARAVLRRHFPNAKLYSDITELDPAELEPVDVITYGFPCQDLSVAGKRAGMKDGTRSGLFYDAIRIIRRISPRYSIAENVPGLFSSDDGRDFAAVLGSLAELGTDTAWATLDSQWFNVPQRRLRVFIVTDFGGERAGEILSLTEGMQGHPAPSREKGEGVAGGVAGCLGGGGEREWSNDLDGSGAFIPEVCGTLSDGAHHGGGLNGQDAYSGRIFPVCTGGGKPGEGYPAVRQAMQVRRLTPTETARLQGFPDDWTAWGIDDDGKRIEMSDSARYKQMGNAVTVNVAHWLAQQVIKEGHYGN